MDFGKHLGYSTDMKITFYGVDEGEQDIRETFGPFKSIMVGTDYVDVVQQDNSIIRLMEGFYDDNGILWTNEPKFLKGKFNEKSIDRTEYTGFIVE